MECLLSLVGVSAACNGGTYPAYLDKVPGIDIQNAADTAQLTGVELLNKCIENAAEQIRSDIETTMQDEFLLQEIRHDYTIGRWLDSYHSSVDRTGYVIEECGTCDYSSYYIESVEFQAKEDFDGTVKVTVGNVTTEYEATGLAEQRGYVEINQFVNAKQFTITLESDTDFQLLQLDNVCGYEQLIGKGGLKVRYQDRCNIDRLICAHKSLYTMPLKWLATVYFFMESAVTQRVNHYTTYTSREELKYNTNKYARMYEASLKTANNKLLNVVSGKCCVKCNQSHWQYARP